MQYKSGRSMEIKQLKKLNKFKKIPSELSFKPKNEPTNPLFRNLKIIKFKDILVCNCIFVHNQINENLPKSFNKFFTTAPAQHSYNTRGSRNNTIIK